LAQDLSFQQKQIVEEKKYIVSSPTMVPTHFPVNPIYNMLVEHIQSRQQQVCDSLQQAKSCNFLSKTKSSLRFRFNKCFLLSPENSTQWVPLLPNEGKLIQVDIGGHPPIPTGSKQFDDNLLF
jgi:hypothetical protein